MFVAESIGRILRTSCISYLPHLVALPTHIPFAFLQKETSCELSLENEIANDDAYDISDRLVIRMTALLGKAVSPISSSGWDPKAFPLRQARTWPEDRSSDRWCHGEVHYMTSRPSCQCHESANFSRSIERRRPCYRLASRVLSFPCVLIAIRTRYRKNFRSERHENRAVCAPRFTRPPQFVNGLTIDISVQRRNISRWRKR